MYAIVTTGGKQYKVAEGDIIDVEKLDVEPGATVKLDVLMLSDGKKITVDSASLAKTKVEAKVLEQFKGEKQLVFKFEKRKRYHRTNGHRQNLTKIEIGAIPGGKAPAKKKSSTTSEAEKDSE